MFPRYSRDGVWIYFSGYLADGSWTIWRVHPDGSSLERVPINYTGPQTRPDPSPDGTRLAIVTGSAARTVDLPQGATSSWMVTGITARWSPTGERLAVMPNGQGPIMVVSADGLDRMHRMRMSVTRPVSPCEPWGPRECARRRATLLDRRPARPALGAPRSTSPQRNTRVTRERISNLRSYVTAAAASRKSVSMSGVPSSTVLIRQGTHARSGEHLAVARVQPVELGLPR